MSPLRITGVPLERLGEPAAAGLQDVLNAQRHESTEAIMTQCADRFEHRLLEETSKLLLEMAEARSETRAGFAEVRRDMAAERFEHLKWAVAFWFGQLAGVAAIVGLLLRVMPPR
jgi:hypothetical protein